MDFNKYRSYFCSIVLVLGMGGMHQPILAVSPTEYHVTMPASRTLTQGQKLEVPLSDDIISIPAPKFSWQIAGLSMLFMVSMDHVGSFANRHLLWSMWPIVVPKLLTYSSSLDPNLLYPSLIVLFGVVVSVIADATITLTSLAMQLYCPGSCLVFSLVFSLIEELTFRKFGQNLLIYLFKKPSIGIGLTSIVCALFHLPTNYIHTGCNSLGYGYIYFWTQDLRYGILAHALCNLYPSIELLVHANSNWFMPIWALLALFSGDALYAQYQQSQEIAYNSLFERLQAKFKVLI